MKLTKIIIAVAMLLTVQSTNLFAQQPPKASNGCVSGNCVNGKGKYVYANGDIYEGDFVNGKREGQGTYTNKYGNYYTGEWKNDKQNGYGKEYVKATNAVREGTWKDGVFVGKQ